MPDAEQLGQIETYHGVAYADWWDFVDAAGTAIALTGKAFTCHVRSGTPDQPGAVVVTISTANGKLTISSNRLSIALTAAELLTLAVGDYYFELVDVTGGSGVEVVNRGWWSHRPTGVGTGA